MGCAALIGAVVILIAAFNFGPWAVLGWLAIVCVIVALFRD